MREALDDLDRLGTGIALTIDECRRDAKRICQGCEVRAECLEYALANDERFGLWGGLSERERRKLKRRVV